ncbi:MAG: redoxin domain-containing protein [Bdellovibrionota bacterium]
MDNRLQRGDWAPPFKTTDIQGREVDFSSFADWGIWLAFYRYASCPMCNQHFDDVMGRQAELFENRVTFISVFESEPKNFPKNILSRSFPNLTIIADPEHSLYTLYGVERSWGKLFTPQSAIERVRAGLAGYMEGKIDGPLDRIPAHFLILPQGIIHQARYGKTAADHIKWRDLEDFYASVRGQLNQVNRVPTPTRPVAPAPPQPPSDNDKTELIRTVKLELDSPEDLRKDEN